MHKRQISPVTQRLCEDKPRRTHGAGECHVKLRRCKDLRRIDDKINVITSYSIHYTKLYDLHVKKSDGVVVKLEPVAMSKSVWKEKTVKGKKELVEVPVLSLYQFPVQLVV